MRSDEVMWGEDDSISSEALSMSTPANSIHEVLDYSLLGCGEDDASCYMHLYCIEAMRYKRYPDTTSPPQSRLTYEVSGDGSGDPRVRRGEEDDTL